MSNGKIATICHIHEASQTHIVHRALALHAYVYICAYRFCFLPFTVYFTALCFYYTRCCRLFLVIIDVAIVVLSNFS